MSQVSPKTSQVSEIRGRKRPVPSGRLARVLRWLRWPLLAVWLLAAVLLFPLAHSLGSVANSTAAANLPSAAPRTRCSTPRSASLRSSC
jgi:hypothetical protein